MKNKSDSYHLLEQENWSRKEHFDFYQKFEQPYFNICCDLEAQNLFEFCNKKKISF